MFPFSIVELLNICYNKTIFRKYFWFVRLPMKQKSEIYEPHVGFFLVISFSDGNFLFLYFLLGWKCKILALLILVCRRLFWNILFSAIINVQHNSKDSHPNWLINQWTDHWLTLGQSDPHRASNTEWNSTTIPQCSASHVRDDEKNSEECLHLLEDHWNDTS